MREIIKNGVRIDDTFAEAFPMRGTAIIITAPNPKVGAPGGDDDDRLCHLGHRLRRRSRHRPRGRAGETPDGRPGVRVLLLSMSTDMLQTPARQSRRPMRADLAGLGLLRAILQAPDQAGDRRFAALFRRWLADFEEIRRPAFLAHSGDGRRVPLRSDDGPHQEERSAAAISSSWAPSFANDNERGGSRGRGDARRRERDHAVPRRHRALGLEGRLEICRRASLDQRRLLPDAARRGQKRARRRRRRGARNRHRRPDREMRSPRRCAPGSRRSSSSVRRTARCASAPAITAASSAPSTSI